MIRQRSPGCKASVIGTAMRAPSVRRLWRCDRRVRMDAWVGARDGEVVPPAPKVACAPMQSPW
jgi:hypothetical protein